MGNKPVIIRTLDIGADKKADCIPMENEENPALGLRAIRLCLKRPDIFKSQLRAIYRASVKGNIYIMIPMITTTEELIKTREMADEVKKELKSENKEFKDIPIGIMIETPSAALISDEQNPSLSDLYTADSTAVLRLIKMAADNIHKRGKWIGICGEAAADKELLEIFMAMGIDELSVSPKRVLYVREAVSNTSGSADIDKYDI